MIQGFTTTIADNFEFASKQINNGNKANCKSVDGVRLGLIGVQTISLAGMAICGTAAGFAASALIAGSPLAILGLSVAAAATVLFRDTFVIAENMNQGLKGNFLKKQALLRLMQLNYTTPYLDKTLARSLWDKLALKPMIEGKSLHKHLTNALSQAA